MARLVLCVTCSLLIGAMSGCSDESTAAGGSGGTGATGGTAGNGGSAGTGGGHSPGDLLQFVDDQVAANMTEFDVAGVAIALLGPEGVPIERTYGMANVEQSMPIGVDTPFNLASLTKQFTATAAMILYEEGKLRPEDLVADYFPEAPAAWREEGLTVHHLLTHQSGIPDFLNDTLGGGWTNEEVLAWAISVPPEFSPGAQYEYSNTGYTLLAILVERISEQSFPSFVQERIFAPLDMMSSSVPEDWPADIPNKAQSYFEGAQYEFPRRAMGEGTNHSSLRDLERWELSLRDPTVVSPETAELMITPHAVWPYDPDCGYGYGWVICDRPGEPLNAFHDGVSSGYRTFITRAPEEGVTVIMLSNGRFDWAISMADDLWRFALGLDTTSQSKARAADPIAEMGWR